MNPKDYKNIVSRRKFMGQISCAGMGYMTLMNSLLNFKAMNAAALSNSSMGGYKAIVCILQAGGNDSFNTLIPISDYAEYAVTRSNLAIPAYDNNDPSNMYNVRLLDGTHQGGKQYGVHPSLSGVQSLFNNNKLSFISNIGTLMSPMNKNQFENKLVKRPLGLFSHSDQIQQWQTAIMDERTATGWAGKISDIIGDQNNNQNISMNITLSGTNIFQSGNSTVEYSINDQGSIGIDGYDPNGWLYNQLRTQAIDNMLAQTYQDIFKKTYVDTIRQSKSAHEEFSEAIGKYTEFESGGAHEAIFSSANPVSQQLKMIARTIAVSTEDASNGSVGPTDILDFERQVFFVNFGGWDHHDELLDSQLGMLGVLGDALNEFNQALEILGMDDQVLTMTTSEFGRTLTSNGDGSDHAWGGNVMVMGGPNLVNGGQIFGTYPSLALNGPNEIGNGVLLPTTATDCYFGEVSKWFGLSNGDINDIFPRLSEFHSISSSPRPIGFLK
jgi:uncharacterized protein (DUF1501 family)